MLITILALAAPFAPQVRSIPPPPPAARQEVRGPEWFAGSFEEALVDAERSGKLVFVELRTADCRICEKMNREALAAPSVVRSLGELICLRLDAESARGRPVAARYGVRGYPTFLFFESDGSPRDGFDGYWPTNLFRREVERIRSDDGTIPDRRLRVSETPDDPRLRLDLALRLEVFGATDWIETEKRAARDLIAREVGFDPDSVEDRWQLCTRLRSNGMKELAAAQIQAILALDPERRSVPGRRITLEKLISRVKLQGDGTALRDFLAGETDRELRYEGWRWIQKLCHWKVSRSRSDEEVAHWRRSWREAAREVWGNVPHDERATQANNIAWSFYEDAGSLTGEEKRFALELATLAVQLAPEEVNTIDTYACCLFLNGRVDEAIEQARRCIELDPESRMWRNRWKTFSGRRASGG